MVARATYIAAKGWRCSHGIAENTNKQLFIKFLVRGNPAMDDWRAYRGICEDKNLGVRFNFDVVEHNVHHGTPGSADFFGVKLGYVFSDLIWEAYIDSCETNGIAPEIRKTKAEVEVEFTDAFGVASYANVSWLRAWRLIFLESDGLVIDPVVNFPAMRNIKQNERFPTIRLDLMEPRFQSDHDDLMKHLS